MRSPLIADTLGYSRFALGLRGFLREKITLEQSKKMISERLRNREQNFLGVLRTTVFGNPESPYRKLLTHAGCQYGDIETSVKRDGIEATLRVLLNAGVYVDWDELKGKKEAKRGASSFQFTESGFDNPLLSGGFHVQSSGTRNAGTRTMFDLGHLEQMSYYYGPIFAVGNALDHPRGLWRAAFPSGAGIVDILFNWKTGNPVSRWFVPVTEDQTRASLRDRLATKYIILASRFCSTNALKPEHVSLDGAATVARWMSDTVRQSGGCSLSSFVSPALKVCQAARDNGLDIEGAHFSVGGEPLTPAKRRQIEAVGATVALRYAVTEIGYVGCGCPQGRTTDDVHVFRDNIALIQHRRTVDNTDIDVDAFLFTTLLPTAPRILLNVANDDYGVLETRDCDCLFGELGFKEHVHDIRSYSKLTGSGMTIIGSDFVRILEEVLPAKYGGAPTDYQLIEEEDSRGETLLNLVISPEIGGVDEREVVDTVLEELRGGARGSQLAAAFWSQLNTIQVRREYPSTSSGKISTLHLAKRQ